jgi:hypothetical protein
MNLKELKQLQDELNLAYGKWSSVELMREFMHLNIHAKDAEDEVRTDVDFRMGIIHKLLKEKLHPAQFRATMKTFDEVNYRSYRTQERRKSVK